MKVKRDRQILLLEHMKQRISASLPCWMEPFHPTSQSWASVRKGLRSAPDECPFCNSLVLPPFTAVLERITTLNAISTNQSSGIPVQTALQYLTPLKKKNEYTGLSQSQQ